MLYDVNEIFFYALRFCSTVGWMKVFLELRNGVLLPAGPHRYRGQPQYHLRNVNQVVRLGRTCNADQSNPFESACVYFYNVTSIFSGAPLGLK